MLRLLLVLLLLLGLAGGRRAALLRLGLRGSPLREVSPAFLSLTLDASLARNPRFVALLSNVKLRALAAALSPGFLRFGGTETDFLIFDPNEDSTPEEKTLWELEVQQGSPLLSSMERRSVDLQHSLWQKQHQPWKREEGHRGHHVHPSICWNSPFGTPCFLQQPWELPHCLGGSQGPCGSTPAFAAVEKLLLSQWPSQEKQILADYNRKKHRNTTITRNTLDILYSFVNCSGFHLIFGLNALLRKDGFQWDSSNAQALLDYCASQRYNISWELGNEPNSFRKKSGIYIDGFQLGQDFIHLRQLLSNYTFYQHTKLYGPDVGQPRKHTQRLLRSFLKSGGKVINSVTWHHYYVNGRSATREDFLSPKVLDSFATAVHEVLEVPCLVQSFPRSVSRGLAENAG